MSLEVYYSDAACTRAVSLAYSPIGECRITGCEEVDGSGYTKVVCGIQGSFEDLAAAVFGPATMYMDSRIYGSSDCSGNATQYEADLLGLCIPVSSGSFEYDEDNFRSWSNQNCSGTSKTTIPNTNACERLSTGGSDMLVGIVKITEDVAAATNSTVSTVTAKALTAAATLSFVPSVAANTTNVGHENGARHVPGIYFVQFAVWAVLFLF
ncbi:hypothetical protein HDU84_002321 [Entophlyctis sp. JEL0112]|nr:hypothetical protein HDU84_002321 [Entophlyctis sp. JEL0112]